MKVKINNQDKIYNEIYIPDKEVKCIIPDFLILGPQRTGTTWLSENLRYHPQVFISYPKEIYFLSRLNYNAKSFYVEKFLFSIGNHKLFSMLKSFIQLVYIKLFYEQFYKKNDIRVYSKYFKVSIFQIFQKTIRFKKVYRPTIRGEATATNMVIDEEVVREITQINPDLKCIVIVRDPVERAWSHAKKDLVRNQAKKYDDIPFYQFVEFFEGDFQINCGSYCRNIDKWSKYLKPGNLLVLSFNEISANPNKLVERVLEFLNVESELSYFGNKLNTKINVTNKMNIPEEYKKILDKLFEKEKIDLSRRYNIKFD